MANPVSLVRPQQIAADKVLLDLVSTYRDAQGSSDDVYDPGTLEYGPSSTDITEVLPATTRAKLKYQLRQGARTEAGEPWVFAEYVLSVPGTTTVPSGDLFMPGDWVKVEASVYDPGLVGKWLRVVEEVHGTIKVFRQARCIMKTEGPQ